MFLFIKVSIFLFLTNDAILLTDIVKLNIYFANRLILILWFRFEFTFDLNLKIATLLIGS